jgi:hypothetical protein
MIPAMLRATPPDEPAALARQGERHGVVWARGVVARGAIEALCQALDRWLVTLGWTHPDGRPVGQTPAYDDPAIAALQQRALGSAELATVRSDPGLLRVVADVLGGPVTLCGADLVRVRCSGFDGTPPHQDGHYLQNHPSLWTVWLPLHVTPIEMGPVAVLPGSHRWGLLPHEGPSGRAILPEAHARWSSAALHPGDVVMFHGHTVHASLPHRVPRTTRRSVDLRFRSV